MNEWRLDQVGREFDEEPSSAPRSAGDSLSAAASGRLRSERLKTKDGNLGWLWLLIAAVLMGGAGGFGIWYMFLAPTPTATLEPVLINADDSPTRIAPDDPGGMQVPHQERLVLQDFEDRGPPADSTARPAPEQPVPVVTADVGPVTPVARIDPESAPLPTGASDASAVSPDIAPMDTAPAVTAPAVEVLMPRLPNEADLPQPPDWTAEPQVVVAEEPAAPAAIEARAEPAHPVMPAQRLPGPLMASTMGRDPTRPDASETEDPFVDLMTALTWPLEQRSMPPDAAEAVPISASSQDNPVPASWLDVAAPGGAAGTQQVAALPEPETTETTVSRDAIGPRFVPQPDAGYRVQIVAVQAEAEAMSEWDRFARLYPGLLGGFEPYVQQVDLDDRGIWYRVQAGPLDWSGANELCTALQEQGADCIVRQR